MSISLNQPPAAAALPVCPPHQTHSCAFLLPSVDDLLRSLIRPSDIFTSITGPCLPQVVLLFMNLVHRAAHCTDPVDTHNAFLRLQMFPTAVLRRSFRGEPGWRTKSGQLKALSFRIRRAGSVSQWPVLWHEAVSAHQARQQWHERTQRRADPPTTHNRRAARAMRLASQAQYARAIRTLTNAPLADLNDPDTLASLKDLHLPAPHPVTAVTQSDLPPAPTIEENSVLRAVKSLNPHAAAGPDRMSPRLLHLLVTAPVSPAAGLTGFGTLTRLVRRLARGDIPGATIPLISAATLLPIKPRPCKIRPIAIGQCLRRLVMKVLLAAAIADTRDYLPPGQLSNSVPCGMDSLVHNARMISMRNSKVPDFIVVSIDARNASNSFSRQRTLHSLPRRAPSLARFCNIVYGRTIPPLVLPSTPPRILSSREGTQQGDPSSMLLFSLAIQPLIRRISQTCNLAMNRWYADDGTLAGRLSDALKALRIHVSEGPTHQFYLNPNKTAVYWPCFPATYPKSLTSLLPSSNISGQGIALLGTPIGSSSYMVRHVSQRLHDVDNALELLEDITDARIKFHLHRLTASVCRIHHLFRLFPPNFSLPFARQFDNAQIRAYSRFHHVPLSESVIAQVRLPFRLGGHCLTAMTPLVDAAHAASLIESAPVRLSGPEFATVPLYRRMARLSLRRMILNLPASLRPPAFNNMLPLVHDYNLGSFEPDALTERPERIHKYLFQVIHQSVADSYWDIAIWQKQPRPSAHGLSTMRRRVRYQSLMAPGASAFLNAHPSLTSVVRSPQ